jgi:hypothetical protein
MAMITGYPEERSYMKRIKMLFLIIIYLMASASCTLNHSINNDTYDKSITTTLDNFYILKTVSNTHEDIKTIQQWQPKLLNYKTNLFKRWIIPTEYKYTTNPKHYIIEKYRSYPNSWGVFEMMLEHNSKLFSGFIDPDTGKYNNNLDSLGITDGEYLYINDALIEEPTNCYELGEMKAVWNDMEDKYVVGGLCSNPSPLFISKGCLIYINSNCIGDIDNIIRINPGTGRSNWTLELKESTQQSENLSISLHSANSDFIIIKAVKSLRSDQDAQQFDDNENCGYFKINPTDGSVSKVEIDSKYDVIRSVRCDEMILMETLDNKFLIYNPENDEVVEHDIIKQTGYNVTRDTYMQIDYILENKLLISLSDSIESFQYFTYDFKSKKLTKINKENVNSVKVVNGSLIVAYGNKSECIDPETQETLWTIEHKNGGSVKWLDWRGVLVYQDDQLVCYVPKN